MSDSLLSQPSRTILSSTRRHSYGALLLFFVVYAGAMAIIFAPEGSFLSKPGPGQYEVQP